MTAGFEIETYLLPDLWPDRLVHDFQSASSQNIYVLFSRSALTVISEGF